MEMDLEFEKLEFETFFSLSKLSKLEMLVFPSPPLPSQFDRAKNDPFLERKYRKCIVVAFK